jgi:hypothetical protein
MDMGSERTWPPLEYQIYLQQRYAVAVDRLYTNNAKNVHSRYLWSKASIRTPVKLQGIGHDILSIIFQFCAEDDWVSPLVIADVCRTWRTLVISTPRAWIHIDLNSLLPDKGIRLYFERSGQCPLHLCLPRTRSPTILTPVAHRIVCLNIRNISDPLKDIVFPVLVRLHVHLLDACPAALITTQRFPALRHFMLWNTTLSGPLDEDTFPPLLSLAVCASPIDRAWIDAIIATRQSLVTLTVVKRVLEITSPTTCCEITLPRLRHLDVWDWSKGSPCPLILRTPRLTSYAEQSPWLNAPRPLIADLSTVTHARFSKPIDLSTLKFLTHLEYIGSRVHYPSILRQLENACPVLKVAEIFVGVLQTPDIADVNRMSYELRSKRCNPVHVEVCSTLTPLPGIPSPLVSTRPPTFVPFSPIL